MHRNVLLLILVLLMLGINACETSEKVPEPWVPVLEDTGFSYLKDSVSEVMKATEEASQAIQSGQKAESTEALQQAINTLLALHFYYIPMTEVRQMVYDADRLFYLKQLEKTQKKLREAKEVLMEVAYSDGKNLEKSANDLIVGIDELILNIQESSSSVPQEFRELGHRVNLMALKGPLILSGAKFDSVYVP